jgi:glycosyltransferase involved in cell wall biosynthesis
MPGRVIYLVRSWPRLSQTFVVEEILALERRGVDLVVVALTRSGEDLVQPQVGAVRAPVLLLEAASLRGRLRDHVTVLRRCPRRYLATAAYALTRPWLARGYTRSSAPRCWSDAVQVAALVLDLVAGAPAGAHRPTHLHAHFAHDPALVGALTTRLTGLPFSITAHARDLVQTPPRALAARLRHADAVITCCAANVAHLRAVLPASALPPVHLVHHGVRLDTLPTDRPGPSTTLVPSIVSVGRLVEKKGYADLLRALTRLRATGQPFTCAIYGDGPLRAELEELRDTLGLADRLTLAGAVPHTDALAAIARADVFVLAPRVTADGDRDGIPNVLVEAMGCGTPVVTTDAGGVAELVRHDANGLLGPPGDRDWLAAALARVLGDGALAARLGQAGRQTVLADYDVEVAAARLATLFGVEAGGRTGARIGAGIGAGVR